MALAQKNDGDEMVHCCYNKSHVVLKHRLQTHLCKCRKQYSEKILSICPFNTTHSVYAPELQFHLESCPDRRQLDSYLFVVNNESEKQLKPSHVELPSSSENWDEQPECTSYLDQKDEIISKLPILREPVGKSKALRKKFFTEEVKKFHVLHNEDQDSSGSVTKQDSQPLDVINYSEELRIGVGRGMKIEIDEMFSPTHFNAHGYDADDSEDETEDDSFKE